MTDFDTAAYWRQRFENESSFEWLISSEQFMPFLQGFLKTGSTVLNLGSGSSDLHVHLRRQGFVTTSVDFVESAIQHGKALEETVFGNVTTDYLVADATQLPSFERKFDLVVDKSTADAISCGPHLSHLMRSVHASICPEGSWICCSYSADRFAEIPTEMALFEVSVLGKVPLSKSNPFDPDIWTWIYLLKPL
ncbi:protein of unknown function [Taphrina deformans PYCC 5710]|uniref:Methyltransferase domain-containing protein n=1 Tax=Taphrina deformans (strain PYCC 5710 / ATCC 11124 / CBS 356.35 / IMI 108563 / JCM 9778 / NBRC 8474) TaxID=1097556 RepID=R4XLQ1_TAPDE|nr:protein of unknown function [Taphrina deformans PYCC 5710]|eukprot:CCG84225.1 protein of unknown function [Taphrina deformans PYCC 5710]